MEFLALASLFSAVLRVDFLDSSISSIFLFRTSISVSTSTILPSNSSVGSPFSSAATAFLVKLERTNCLPALFFLRPPAVGSIALGRSLSLAGCSSASRCCKAANLNGIGETFVPTAVSLALALKSNEGSGVFSISWGTSSTTSSAVGATVPSPCINGTPSVSANLDSAAPPP